MAAVLPIQQACVYPVAVEAAMPISPRGLGVVPAASVTRLVFVCHVGVALRMPTGRLVQDPAPPASPTQLGCACRVGDSLRCVRRWTQASDGRPGYPDGR